jgi:hypothetical protein
MHDGPDMPEDAALTALAEDHLGQSEARTVAGDLPGARALLEAVREAPGWPGLAPSLRARVLTDLGWISGALMELDRAGTELGEAVRLAEQSGQPGALQDALLEAGAVERYASGGALCCRLPVTSQSRRDPAGFASRRCAKS